MKKHEPKKTAKKGLFRIVFSRSGIMLLLILMQIGDLYDNYISAAGIFDSNQRNHALHASYSNHLRNQFGGQSGI